MCEMPEQQATSSLVDQLKMTLVSYVILINTIIPWKCSIMEGHFHVKAASRDVNKDDKFVQMR